jgi:hypothetical protein
MSTVTTEVICDECELDQEEFDRLVTALQFTKSGHTCRRLGTNVELETWLGQTDMEGTPAYCGIVRLQFWETTLYRARLAPIRDNDADAAKAQIQQFLVGLRFWGR